MTRLRNVGLLAAPAPQVVTAEHVALREVWDGHTAIDFDWDGWRERARTALGIPVSAMAMPPAQEIAQPANTYHEDLGDVLWWRFPVTETPYVGSPLCDDWIEDHYTHWTPLLIPMEPGVG